MAALAIHRKLRIIINPLCSYFSAERCLLFQKKLKNRQKIRTSNMTFSFVVLREDVRCVALAQWRVPIATRILIKSLEVWTTTLQISPPLAMKSTVVNLRNMEKHYYWTHTIASSRNFLDEKSSFDICEALHYTSLHSDRSSCFASHCENEKLGFSIGL